MKRRSTQLFLAIVIIISFPVCATHVCYYTLVAADFLAPHVYFEDFDQDYLLAACSNLKACGSIVFVDCSHLADCLFGLSPLLFSQISSPNHKTFILRC